MHIEFTEGEDKITLEGPTKDVQMVQSQIEAIVADLVSDDPRSLKSCNDEHDCRGNLDLHLAGQPYGLHGDQCGSQVSQTPDWKRRCQQ